MKLNLIKHNKVIAHFQKEHITSKDFISLLKMGYDIRLANCELDKDQASLIDKDNNQAEGNEHNLI